jgi:RsiW-degrading membrane proteinase PrsW (M82 family)
MNAGAYIGFLVWVVIVLVALAKRGRVSILRGLFLLAVLAGSGFAIGELLS